MKSSVLLPVILVAWVACKPSGSPSASQNLPETPSPSVSDTSTTGTPAEEATMVNPVAESPATSPASDQPQLPVAPKPKVCAPNFTKLATPAAQHYIYYVTQFNPEEFKCWVLLEEHGTGISGSNPCVVYYVDDPKIKIEPSLPHHMSEAALRTGAIARYVHNGKYWEIKGASQWKRKDKGYGYYNTDNQLGG